MQDMQVFYLVQGLQNKKMLNTDQATMTKMQLMQMVVRGKIEVISLSVKVEKVSVIKRFISNTTKDLKRYGMQTKQKHHFKN